MRKIYNVRAGYYDINAAALPESETFDFIPFNSGLYVPWIPLNLAIIKNMQERTVVGGYNLFVCAMDTEEQFLVPSHLRVLKRS